MDGARRGLHRPGLPDQDPAGAPRRPLLRLAYLIAARRPCARSSTRSSQSAPRCSRPGGSRSSSSSRRPPPLHRWQPDQLLPRAYLRLQRARSMEGDETGLGGRRREGWGARPASRACSSPSVGGQVSWLIPSCLILLLAGLWLCAAAAHRPAPRGIPRLGWLARRDDPRLLPHGRDLPRVLHRRPGAGDRRPRGHGRRRGLGAAAARWPPSRSRPPRRAATWGFDLLSRTTAYGDWLRFSVLVVGLLAAVLLLVSRRWSAGQGARGGRGGWGVVAARAGPAYHEFVSEAHTGSIVFAGPADATVRVGCRASVERARRPRPGVDSARRRWAVGVASRPSKGPRRGWRSARRSRAQHRSGRCAVGQRSVVHLGGSRSRLQSAAGLQIATQLPVKVGGFNGSDPSPTLEQFQQYVAEGDPPLRRWRARLRRMWGRWAAALPARRSPPRVQENLLSVTMDGTTFPR